MGLMDLDQVIREILEREAVNGIRIIGVDGPSGSGKSLLARRLAARTGAPIVWIDHFVSWSDFGGWWARFDDQVLTPLLQGRDVRFQVRDWDNDEFGTSLSGWQTLSWAPLVLFDGVTCTRRGAADRLAYRVWVQAPHDTRMARGIERDDATHRQLWRDWMETEATFFERDQTRERADLRVNGAPTVPHDPERQVVTFDP